MCRVLSKYIFQLQHAINKSENYYNCSSSKTMLTPPIDYLHDMHYHHQHTLHIDNYHTPLAPGSFMQCAVPLCTPLHAVPKGQQPPCWQQIGAEAGQHAPVPKPGQPNGRSGGQQSPVVDPKATPPHTHETGPATPSPPFQQHISAWP